MIRYCSHVSCCTWKMDQCIDGNIKPAMILGKAVVNFPENSCSNKNNDVPAHCLSAVLFCCPLTAQFSSKKYFVCIVCYQLKDIMNIVHAFRLFGALTSTDSYLCDSQSVSKLCFCYNNGRRYFFWHFCCMHELYAGWCENKPLDTCNRLCGSFIAFYSITVFCCLWV